jgi:ABC-type multidrug transport system permease subunit
MRNQIKICGALLRRHLYVAKESFMGSFVNCLVIVGFQAFFYGYVFPTVGFDSAHISTVFVGVIILTLMYATFSRALECNKDVRFGKYINFERMLPLSLYSILGVYAISFIVELLSYTFFLCSFGKLFLGELLFLGNANWLLVCVHGLAGALFWASLMLFIGFGLSFEWVIDHLWTRLLLPFIFLGCVWYAWPAVNETFPVLARCMLINPSVYFAEGLRHALFGVDTIGIWYCIAGLLVASAVLFGLLAVRITKQLD